jgi:hypothetical protein
MVIKKLDPPFFALRIVFHENRLPLKAIRWEDEILLQQRYDKSKRRNIIRRPQSSRYQEQLFPQREISPLPIPEKESLNGENEGLGLA